MSTTLSTQNHTISHQLVAIIREDDDLQHAEDTSLYWVTRQGRAHKLAWNEMSEQEQAEQIQAKERADFVAMFVDCIYSN